MEGGQGRAGRTLTVFCQTRAPLGLRLEEAPQPREGSRVRIVALSPLAQPAVALKLRKGDWLGDVGFKATNHVVWAWETISGYSLEDAYATIQEASRLGRLMAIRVVRFEDDDFGEEDATYRPNGPDPLPLSSHEPLLKPTGFGQLTCSRVGEEFQATDLPAYIADAHPDADANANPMLEGDCVLYSPPNLPNEVIDDFLKRAQCRHDEQDWWLNRLFECQGNVDLALESPRPNFEAKQLNALERTNFEAAIWSTGARDFSMIRKEMATDRPLGDLIEHYYSQWKCAGVDYRKWRGAMAQRFGVAGRLCTVCTQQDTYNQMLLCASCRRFFHLECVETGPLVRISPELRFTWRCLNCNPNSSNGYAVRRSASGPSNMKRPPGRPRKVVVGGDVLASEHSQGQPRPAVRPPKHSSSLAGDSPDRPTWASSSRNPGDDGVYEGERPKRIAAAAATRMWATEGDDLATFYEPVEPVPVPAVKRRKSRVEKPTEYDESGRVILMIKGQRLDPDGLKRAVESLGGLSVVSTNKLWQNVRHVLGIPSTIPGTQKLIDVYMSCISSEVGSGAGRVANGEAHEEAENDDDGEDDAEHGAVQVDDGGGGGKEAEAAINGGGHQAENNEEGDDVDFDNEGDEEEAEEL